MVGRSPRADSDRPKTTSAPTTPAAAIDPTASWVAQLITPTRAVRRGSQEHLAVRVDAPVELLGQQVQLGLESRVGGTAWSTGTWMGPAGRSRVVVATLGSGALNVDPGLYRIMVRIYATKAYTPVLDAGQISIT